jgi:hypothetical protein
MTAPSRIVNLTNIVNLLVINEGLHFGQTYPVRGSAILEEVLGDVTMYPRLGLPVRPPMRYGGIALNERAIAAIEELGAGERGPVGVICPALVAEQWAYREPNLFPKVDIFSPDSGPYGVLRSPDSGAIIGCRQLIRWPRNKD